MRTLFFAILIACATSLSAAKNDSVPEAGIIRLDYPKSLNDVLIQFKGKVIYIDVMASWCKPCLEELTHTQKLETFFKENDIVKIFITIDNPDAIDQCLKMLKDRKLRGYFLSYHNDKEENTLNSTFPQDIDPFFLSFDESGNMKEMSVPQFVIIDKEGHIATLKAERPSNPDALKSQLRKYLKSNTSKQKH